MNKLLLGAVAALISPVLVTPALAARDYSNDIVCAMRDTRGNEVGWLFGYNDTTSFVETGFVKNGATTVSPVGRRPIWRVRFVGEAVVFGPQNDPGYFMLLKNGRASLWKGRKLKASGTCNIPTVGAVDNGY